MNFAKISFAFLFISAGLLCSQPLLGQSETRNVGSFKGVQLNIPGKLYLRQGSPQKVVIEASREVLERIETDIVSGNLVIRQENGSWWKSWKDRGTIKVYITAPNLEHISVSGSGSIKSENTIRADRMYLGVSGSGDMDLEVETQNLDSKISGSGSMDLKGRARNTEISISGSGNMDGESLSTNTCEVRISGSGNCRIEVSESLDSRVSGSGNIYYRGNPDKVSNHSSGSGSIKKIG